MLYFDTSYLFRLYSQEPGHLAVKALPINGQGVATAVHARIEFASIVLRRRREKSDAETFLRELHSQFLDEVRDGHIHLLPLTQPVLLTAEEVFRKAPAATFLRAADALHLACAATHGFREIYSNDRHLLAAAPLFGLQGVNVIG